MKTTLLVFLSLLVLVGGVYGATAVYSAHKLSAELSAKIQDIQALETKIQGLVSTISLLDMKVALVEEEMKKRTSVARVRISGALQNEGASTSQVIQDWNGSW